MKNLKFYELNECEDGNYGDGTEDGCENQDWEGN